MSAEAIAKALGGRKAGAPWMARCPAHQDREPSCQSRMETTAKRWSTAIPDASGIGSSRRYERAEFGLIATNLRPRFPN